MRRVTAVLFLALLTLGAVRADAGTYWPLQPGLTYTFETPGGARSTLETESFGGSMWIHYEFDTCAWSMRFETSPDGVTTFHRYSVFCEGAIDPDMYEYDPGVLFLDAGMQVGDSWRGALHMTNFGAPSFAEYRIEVLRQETKTVPHGTFDTLVVSMVAWPFPFPFPLSGEIWLHEDRGPIAIGDAELVSITGAVPNDASSFGTLKSRYGHEDD